MTGTPIPATGLLLLGLLVVVVVLLGCCLCGRRRRRRTAPQPIRLQAASSSGGQPIYVVSGANVSTFDGRYSHVASTGAVPEHWKHQGGDGYLVRLTTGGWALAFSSPASLNWAGSSLKYSLDWKELNGKAHAYTTSATPTAGNWNEWKKGAYSARNLRLVSEVYTAKEGCGPLVSECRSRTCGAEDAGKFCPPDAPGGSGSSDGYCCVDGQWKAGTCCEQEVEREDPPSFTDELCTWVSYADTFKSAVECFEGDEEQCASATEDLVELGMCLPSGSSGMSKACEVIETLSRVKSDANLASDLEDFKKLLEDGEEGGVGVAVDAASLACRSRAFVKDAMSLFGGCSVDCAEQGLVCAGGHCRTCSADDFDKGAKCAFRDGAGKLEDGFCREKDGNDQEVWDCHQLKPLHWGCEDDSECESGYCRDVVGGKKCTECGEVGTNCGGGKWCREKDANGNVVYDCHPCKPSGWGAGSGDDHLPGSVCCSGRVVKTDNCNFWGDNCDYKCA